MELNFNPTYNKHPQLLIKFLLKNVCVTHKTLLYFWSIKLLFDLIIYFIYKSEIEIKHELILMTFDHWFTCFSFFLDINTLAYFLCVKLCIMTLFKECLVESCMIFLSLRCSSFRRLHRVYMACPYLRIWRSGGP